MVDAIQKYRKENFVVELIEECDETLGDEKERYYIQYFDSINNGYNITTGGKKYKMAEETKKILSESRKGKHFSPNSQFKKGQVSPMKGKHLSEERKRKLSIERKGKHFSPATEFTSERCKGAKNSRAYPVYQYDLNGNFIAEYETALLASQVTKVHRQDICLCRCGRIPQAGGYVWKKERI